MADKSYGAEFFAGFVVGGLVGAAAAILFAPQSGEDTRALIRVKGVELQERSVEVSDEARRRGKEYGVQAKDKAGQLTTQTKEKASAWQGSMRASIDQGKAAAGEQKEELVVRVQEEDLQEVDILIEEDPQTDE